MYLCIIILIVSIIKHTYIEYKIIFNIIIRNSRLKSMIFFCHIVQTASTVFGKICLNVLYILDSLRG